MSQNNTTLNPVLQAALNSLDVQLEEELARYRRQRLGRPVMSAKGLGRHQARKSLDLIDVERVQNQPPRPALGMSTAPLADFPLYMVQPPPQSAANPATPAASSNQVNVPPAPPESLLAAPDQAPEPLHQPPSPQTPPEQPGNLATIATQTPPQDYLESSEQLLKSLAQEEATPPPKKPFAAKFLTPLGVGSILLLLLSGATAVYVLSNPSSFAALGLDRFFGKKNPTPVAPSPSATTSLTGNADNAPVVNGPDLATDEFVDLNLNTLSHLQASPKSVQPTVPVQVPALPTLPNAPVVQPVAPTVVPNNALPPRRAADLSSVLLTPSPQGNAPYTPIPKVAPLPTPASNAPKSNNTSGAAYRSFKTNTAKTKAKANTADKSLKTKANKSQISTTAKAQNKSAQSKPSKSAKTTEAKKQAAQTPNQVATTPIGSGSGYYFVLLNSNSQSLLEQARAIVPDAYLETFPKGTKIQMGAYPTESEAKAMVEQLERQGLAASIYHP